MILSAELPEGYGDLDLYVCFREGRKWSQPRNLGPIVNTFGREAYPYLEENGEILYFSSNGHPGYGKGDVFQVRRTSKTWTQWEGPLNLGPAINGYTWDICFLPHPDIKQSYFMSSVDSARGDYDVFRVTVPVDITTSPYAGFMEKSFMLETEILLGGDVQLWGISREGKMGKVAGADGQDGSYGMYVDLGNAYQIYAIKPGYLPVIDTLDVRAFESYREVRKISF